MSAADDDAALEGDYLADLVNAGLLTDREALAHMAGDPAIRKKVAALAERESVALNQPESSEGESGV